MSSAGYDDINNNNSSNTMSSAGYDDINNNNNHHHLLRTRGTCRVQASYQFTFKL